MPILAKHPAFVTRASQTYVGEKVFGYRLKAIFSRFILTLKFRKLQLCSKGIVECGVQGNHLFTFLLCSGLKLHDALVNLVDGTLSCCKLFLVSAALKSLICSCIPFHAASVRL
jgi:hypothetical protein